MECRRYAQVRSSDSGNDLCEGCEQVVQAERLAEWERRQREADDGLVGLIPADRAAAAG